MISGAFRLCLLMLLLMAHGARADGGIRLPILFVHGNGDSAALWMTDIWRFESNGYPPALLAALDFTHPNARAADHQPEPNRSSTDDQSTELAAAVDRMLAASQQDRLILVGSSRGGNAIRNFIRHGGQAKVAMAILCGSANHGVFALPFRWDFEFNGLGPFLRGLNHPHETDEGVRFVTLRSDHADKFAQPTGKYLGYPWLPTFVGSDGPALEGAENIVLNGLDHRQLAFHRLAFAAMYRTITGTEPASLDPIPEPTPQLGGMISGFENGAATNLPLAGVRLTIYQIDPASGARLGAPAWRQRTGADGKWGPFPARPDVPYEFDAEAEGYPATRITHTPFPRSSSLVHIRLAPAGNEAEGRVTLVRPQGYLGRGRDIVTIDGRLPDDLPDGLPATEHASLVISAGTPRPVPVVLNGRLLTVMSAPFSGAVERVIAEFDD